MVSIWFLVTQLLIFNIYYLAINTICIMLKCGLIIHIHIYFIILMLIKVCGFLLYPVTQIILQEIGNLCVKKPHILYQIIDIITFHI